MTNPKEEKVTAQTDRFAPVPAGPVSVEARSEGNGRSIDRLNRLYSVSRKISEAIIRIHDMDELLRRICRVVVEDGGFVMSWIGLVDPDSLVVRPVAVSGREEGYPDIEIMSADQTTPTGRGPTGLAVREGKCFICGDIENDPVMTPWRKAALARGYRSSAAFPLRTGSRVIGSLNLYSTEKQDFDAEVRDMLQSAADSLSFAIQAMENEKALRDSEEKYRTLVENTTDLIYSIDPDGIITYVSPNVSSYGYAAEEVTGRNIAQFVHPDDLEHVFNDLSRAQETGELFLTRFRLMNKAGEYVHVEEIGKAMRRVGRPLQHMGTIRDITERKRAEEAFCESERRFRDMLETLSLVAVVLDVQGNVVFCNDFLLETTGWRREDAIGRDWFGRFLPPDVRDELKSVFLRTVNSGKFPPHYENDIIGSTGKRKLISWNNTVLRDLQGNIVGTASIGEDITERKKAEEALRQSETRFRGLFNNAVIPMAIVDAKGRIIAANDAACRFLGYNEEELIGVHATEITHPDDIESSQWLYGQLIQGELDNYTITKRYIHKTGKILWGQLGASLIRNADNVPQFTIVVCEDITERVRAEQALRESEEKYRTVVEHANEAIIIAQDGYLRYVNPRMEQMSGCTAEELTGVPFADFIYHRDRDMVRDRHMQRLRGELKQDDAYEFRIVRKDGAVRWMDIRTALIAWEGRPATLNLLSDITERKSMEEEVLRIQKLESLGILAGGIAHDFNNVLTAILGNINLTKLSGDVGPRAYERLTEAEQAVLRAQGLTRQLLTFSRGGAPVKKTTSLGAVIRASAEFAVRGSAAKCEFFIDHDLRPADVDEGQISQVIGNIILNAKQAMPGGGVITVRCENRTIDDTDILPLEKGDYVQIAITDQGTGIPREHLPWVFDPYFTTKQEGSGLGLSTSHSIIKRHGGHISVDSDLGKGTTFDIYLPASSEEPLIHGETGDALPCGKGRLLVMDDDELVRDVVAAMLQRLGYDVETAPDGAVVIDQYARSREAGNPFDLVIMDLTVPGGLGGVETARKLREMDPQARVIVSSGYSTDPVMSNYRDYGFNNVIQKPYTLQTLGKVLQSVLHEKGQ
ncbi:MAG TPA: PAS domain S-box protein [Dissulfurispiraceae bacterium]|nr:PAS domain S-box protein [Dissulfurispiraceae bacterium]